MMQRSADDLPQPSNRVMRTTGDSVSGSPPHQARSPHECPGFSLRGGEQVQVFQILEQSLKYSLRVSDFDDDHVEE